MLKNAVVCILIFLISMPTHLAAQDAGSVSTASTPSDAAMPQVTATPQATDAPQATPTPAATQSVQAPPSGFVLLDGTPVKLRLKRNLSSGTDRKGDLVDFEVVEEVLVDNVIVVSKGGTAMATITEAEPKRRMGRGGKLNVNIDSVRLKDNEKVVLRAVKDNSGGGHVGAMTGAMVATAIVFFPAAPLFLFMKGKDVNIPEGTEVTAYVEGNTVLDRAKFDPTYQNAAASSATTAAAQGLVSVNSVPDGADVEVDGSFIGNTPSQVTLPAGDHTVRVSKTGFKPWERKLKVTPSGSVNVNAQLEAAQ